ncbi:MAG: hypothetical protein FD180_2991 [Planctomycetota bacterium]|nr:MAG: hypothetical protein FD180_2991 [Planctomycetota bacterium]
MRKFCTALCVCAFALGAVADGKKAGKAAPAGYAWETNYEQAKLKAAAEGKLLYIEFWKEG